MRRMRTKLKIKLSTSVSSAGFMHIVGVRNILFIVYNESSLCFESSLRHPAIYVHENFKGMCGGRKWSMSARLTDHHLGSVL